jgi:predicted nucleic acid-binding protein
VIAFADASAIVKLYVAARLGSRFPVRPHDAVHLASALAEGLAVLPTASS